MNAGLVTLVPISSCQAEAEKSNKIHRTGMMSSWLVDHPILDCDRCGGYICMKTGREDALDALYSMRCMIV